MPVYTASILNKQISVNYEDSEKDKLVEAINEINLKLKNYDNQNGKISDSKLLSFLAIKLQAELFDLNVLKKKDDKLQNKLEYNNNENIVLNDKLYKLREQNKLLKKENDFLNQELENLKIQIDTIAGLIKNSYEE